MKILRKSQNGNTILVQRAAGVAVSVRESKWNPGRGYNVAGVQTLEWTTKASGLSLDAGIALFDKLAA